MTDINANLNNSENLEIDSSVSKDSIIALYAHYSGFAIILLERIISCKDYTKKFDKRWTVAKLITGIPSYDLIKKNLKDLKKSSRCLHSIIVNKEINLSKAIRGISFKPSEGAEMATDSDINASVFNLVARVNDRQLVFKKDTAGLIESVKFYNPNNFDVSINALILAVNSIPCSSYQEFLES